MSDVLPSLNEDYEAQCSLRTLLEARKILVEADEDLFQRMRDLIADQDEAMDDVYALLEEGDLAIFTSKPEKIRADSRTVQDFYDRLNSVREEEHAANYQPFRGK